MELRRGGGVGLIIKILALSCRSLQMPVAEQLLCWSVEVLKNQQIHSLRFLLLVFFLYLDNVSVVPEAWCKTEQLKLSCHGQV